MMHIWLNQDSLFHMVEVSFFTSKPWMVFAVAEAGELLAAAQQGKSLLVKCESYRVFVRPCGVTFERDGWHCDDRKFGRFSRLSYFATPSATPSRQR